MDHFNPPWPGPGFRIRIRIHWPDWIRTNPDPDPNPKPWKLQVTSGTVPLNLGVRPRLARISATRFFFSWALPPLPPPPDPSPGPGQLKRRSSRFLTNSHRWGSLLRKAARFKTPCWKSNYERRSPINIKKLDQTSRSFLFHVKLVWL